MKRLRDFFLALIVVTAFVSCTKFKGDQEVPAYLCVKPWTFTTDYNREGAATHAITDAWVYVDGNVQGCYEIRKKDNDTSFTVPILTKGVHKVTLYPGIKMNGIASTRIQYPFYQPIAFENHEFVAGMVDTVRPSTRYYDIDQGFMHFKFKEDFENPTNIFREIDTIIKKVSRLDDIRAWQGDLEHSMYSGRIHLGINEYGDTISKFSIATTPLYNLPNQGDYVLLEIDYNTDLEFEVGLYARTKDGLTPYELLWIRPTGGAWKKVYVNLSPTITTVQSASYFQIFIYGAAANAGDDADFYFDNLKLVYRD